MRSSSGGVVSQLLISALKQKLIDGALVTRMRLDNPTLAEAFLARDAKEIVSASGSRYVPVDVNTILREICDQDGRFALVGLPCHVRALRRAQCTKPELRSKIPYLLGLFCGHVPSIRATVSTLRQMGIERSQVTSLTYRGNGWPGFLTISLEDGRRIQLPYKHELYYGGTFLFLSYYPHGCLFCGDVTNEFADVSFGDPWIPGYIRERYGRSLVVTRTVSGENLIAACADDLVLEPIPPEKVVESQKLVLRLKKENLPTMRTVLKRMRIMQHVSGMSVSHGQSVRGLPRPNPLFYAFGLMFWFNVYGFGCQWLKMAFEKLPFQMQRGYMGIMNTLMRS